MILNYELFSFLFSVIGRVNWEYFLQNVLSTEFMNFDSFVDMPYVYTCTFLLKTR